MTGKFYIAANPKGFQQVTNIAEGLKNHEVIRWPENEARYEYNPDGYYLISDHPGEVRWAWWPMRLFAVKPCDQGERSESEFFKHQLFVKEFEVIEELDPRIAFGPNLDAVLRICEQAALIDRGCAEKIHRVFIEISGPELDRAWEACKEAADRNLLSGTLPSAWSVAMRSSPEFKDRKVSAWGIAFAAAAEFCKGMISQEQYDILMTPWVSVFPEYQAGASLAD